jgi:hypothetical protein
VTIRTALTSPRQGYIELSYSHILAATLAREGDAYAKLKTPCPRSGSGVVGTFHFDSPINGIKRRSR